MFCSVFNDISILSIKCFQCMSVANLNILNALFVLPSFSYFSPAYTCLSFLSLHHMTLTNIYTESCNGTIGLLNSSRSFTVVYCSFIISDFSHLCPTQVHASFFLFKCFPALKMIIRIAYTARITRDIFIKHFQSSLFYNIVLSV